jgi:hypothetical protein
MDAVVWWWPPRYPAADPSRLGVRVLSTASSWAGPATATELPFRLHAGLRRIERSVLSSTFVPRRITSGADDRTLGCRSTSPG